MTGVCEPPWHFVPAKPSETTNSRAIAQTIDPAKGRNKMFPSVPDRTLPAPGSRTGGRRPEDELRPMHDPAGKLDRPMGRMTMRANSVLKTTLRSGASLVCTALAGLALSLPVSARSAITEFDVPGSFGTYPTGINAGVITGFWLDASA